MDMLRISKRSLLSAQQNEFFIDVDTSHWHKNHSSSLSFWAHKAEATNTEQSRCRDIH